MSALIQIVIPRGRSHERAHFLSHQALFIYGLFLLLVQLSINIVSHQFPGVLGFASNITVDEIVSQTNVERANSNLPPLKVNDELTKAATLKANYMFQNDYWAHIAPDGTTPWKFVLNAGYKYLYAGENLAKDFQGSDDVVKAWMASKAGHRENLLGRNYSDIGVAVVNGTLGGFETTLVVQMFGSTSVPLSGSEVSAAPSLNKSTVNLAAKPVTINEQESAFQKGAQAPGIPQAPKPVVVKPLEPVSPLIPVVDVVALAKNISFTFGFFLLALFVLDSLVIFRRGIVRISGHNGAHIMVLLLLLSSTWFLSAGVIR